MFYSTIYNIDGANGDNNNNNNNNNNNSNENFTMIKYYTLFVS